MWPSAAKSKPNVWLRLQIGHGHSQARTPNPAPEGATMPALRTRLILSILILVLVAGACGGDENSTPGSPEDARPEFSSPETPSQDDISDESQDSLQAAIFSQPVVLLGNRFGWCSDVEDVWATLEATLATLLTVEANYEAAIADYETTTDELDRAEARQALNEAERDYNELRGKNQQALTNAAYQLRQARRAQGDQPEDIAYQRAWSALLSADPEVAALSGAVPEESRVPTTTAAPWPDDSNILARVINYKEVYSGPGVRVWNGAAEEAAHGVYSQADSALIAQALHAAAPQAARAAHQLDTRQARDRSQAAYHVLLTAGGAVLAPYDAAAYEAADGTDPNISSRADFYADYVQNLDLNGMIVGNDLFWAVFASRVRVIEAALPAAIDLAQLTDDLRAAEAQAERARQQQAEQALQDALAVAAEGSDAYTTFKRSFQESCA